MKMFNPVELIKKKRDGGKFSRGEIEFLISSYTSEKIPDYQFSALLMAIYFQGMDFEETTHFMKAMLESGRSLELSFIKKPKIDKHSTGGVGDKVSLILAPLLASCGICVPMISGRSLGHTGGTLDKLESIPGFKTDLPVKELRKQLRNIGVVMIGQSPRIAPADRKIYALRDVTATVDSIPLISASIMSKKLAEDLNGLVLDVKFGNGAFMPEYRRAKELARTMVKIGHRAGIKVTAVLTDMNAPLGEYVGNSLEVMESIEALRGRGPEDLMKVTFTLGEEMLRLAKIKGGRRLLRKKIASGEALEVFKKLVCCQEGDVLIFDNILRLPIARRRYSISAEKSGYIHRIDTFKTGMLLVELGGGRLKTTDRIDHSCGFRFLKKPGDYVKKGDCLVEVFSDNRAVT